MLGGGPTGVLGGGPTGRLIGGLTGGLSTGEHGGGVADADWMAPVIATTPTAGTNSAAVSDTTLIDDLRRTLSSCERPLLSVSRTVPTGLDWALEDGRGFVGDAAEISRRVACHLMLQRRPPFGPSSDLSCGE